MWGPVEAELLQTIADHPGTPTALAAHGPSHTWCHVTRDGTAVLLYRDTEYQAYARVEIDGAVSVCLLCKDVVACSTRGLGLVVSHVDGWRQELYVGFEFSLACDRESTLTGA